jgi:hypothetical protein
MMALGAPYLSKAFWITSASPLAPLPKNFSASATTSLRV